MADLDDFFAKKDRKKSKNLKKFATADEVAKKLEDTTKKVDKPVKKERVVQQGQEGDETGTATHEVDEWKDFEEEKKDYSGLKIGHLSISGNGEGSAGNADGNSEMTQGSDDGGNEPDRKSGPWKRVDTEVSAAPPVVEEKPVEPQPAPARPAASGYVAPHLRNQTVQQQQPSRLKSKAAPDIHNEEYFPTLSGGRTAEPGGVWGRRTRNEASFEEVRHNKASSYRQAEQSKMSSGQGPKLTLGNRYGTLSNENSS